MFGVRGKHAYFYITSSVPRKQWMHGVRITVQIGSKEGKNRHESARKPELVRNDHGRAGVLNANTAAEAHAMPSKSSFNTPPLHS